MGDTRITDPAARARTANTFEFTARPRTKAVTPTNYTTFRLSVTSVGAFEKPVSLQVVSVEPTIQGAQWSFDPQVVTPVRGGTARSTFRFRTRDPAERTYSIKVRAQAGGLVKELDLTVEIVLPERRFDLVSSHGSISIPNDAPWSGQVVLRVRAYGGFDDEVTLEVHGGVDPRFELDKSTLRPGGRTRLRITGDGMARPIHDFLPIQGSGGGLSFRLDIDKFVIQVPYSEGTHRILFVPIRGPGQQPSEAIDEIVARVRQATGFFERMSGGKLKFKVDTLDRWYQMSPPLYFSQILKKIRHDVDLTQYQYYVALYDEEPGISGVQASAQRFTHAWIGGDPITFAMAVVTRNAHPTVIAHEIAHTLYLPDLYDVTDRLTTTCGYMGVWSLMSCLPDFEVARLTGWELLKLGWLPEAETRLVPRSMVKDYVLAPLDAIENTSEQPKLIRIPVLRPRRSQPRVIAFRPSYDGQRYYFVEAREGHGVLVYFVDERRGSARGPLILRDARPETQELHDAAFAPAPGQTVSFDDPDLGVSIQIRGRADGLYDVTVANNAGSF